MTAAEECVNKIAVSMTPGINAGVVRGMEACDMTPEEFLNLGMADLSRRLGAGDTFRSENMARQEALFRARREYEFMQRHHIRALYLGDDDYPPLLAELTDAPVLLYVLGKAADLNAPQCLAVVGTRRCTAYGTGFVASMVKDLAAYYPQMAIVSGLAFGIDASGHKAALDNHLSTIACVAHGLDMIYPAQHRDLGRRIIEAGGAIVSEYPTGTRPFQRNFLERNRIIAGLCEVTFVAESEIRGGAMSTANQAFINNREVMALPGRATDKASSGCNHLIRSEKAHLVTCAADVVQLSGWIPDAMSRVPKQKNLFPELEGMARELYDLLKKDAAPVNINDLHQRTGINMKDLIATLTEMEFDGIVSKLPGARYELA